jgi:hypothetical protein
MFERDVDNAAADQAAGDRVSGYRLDEITAAERLIRTEQAKQVDAVVSYVQRQRVLYGESDPVERGCAMEVAAALRCSQGTAQRFIADAETLVADHPGVLDALESGRINLWVARQIVTATGCLKPQLRRLIDANLAAEAATVLPGQVREMVDRRVAEADAEAAAKRARRARADKNVFYAKRPDTIGLLGANLPAEQAAACFEALDHDARAKRADGDQRTIDHIMCDTLVERLTGATKATDAYTIELQVVLTDHALLGTDTTTSELVGYGVLPSDLAVELSATSLAWIRRLLTDPIDGTLTGMDTRRRRFDGPLRSFIMRRDRRCRNVWCGARIRDIDHRHPHADGGATTADNGDGYCERCHYLRDHPGILVDLNRIKGIPRPDDPDPNDNAAESNAHGIIWTGPSGKRYISLAPPAAGLGTLTKEQLNYRMALQHAAIHTEQPHPALARLPQIFGDRAVATA